MLDGLRFEKNMGAQVPFFGVTTYLQLIPRISQSAIRQYESRERQKRISTNANTSYPSPEECLAVVL